MKKLAPLWMLLALAVALLLGSRTARACTGTSATNPCFTHNGSFFLVDIGDGSGFQGRRVLSVKPGVPLTFNIDPACSNCSFHPLYLTPSPVGAGVGPVLAGPIGTGSFSYTPSATTLAQGLYYQCDLHPNMGAQIQAQVAAVPAVPVSALSALAAGLLAAGVALRRRATGSHGFRVRLG
jgi:hypothetical protein